MVELLTKQDLVVLSGCTGVLFSKDFDKVHEYLETKLERPVYTHEMALQKTFNDVKEKSLDEYRNVLEKMFNQTIGAA